MKKYILLFVSILFCFTTKINAQEDLKIKNKPGGIFSLGVRAPISAFNDGNWRNLGTGTGGQFRLRIAERLSTDWFFDYITGNISNFASRTDYHIGWSIVYYLGNKPPDEVKVQPFILAGHCFDYTNQKENNNSSNYKERWSSAVQAGFGSNFNITKRFDVSATAQYMIHLGNDIHAHQENGKVIIHEKKGVNLEGHIFFNISLNYKIIDLW